MCVGGGGVGESAWERSRRPWSWQCLIGRVPR